jgi:hypothetical protein
MATHPATPYQTTLSAALDASSTTIITAAATGFAVGKYVVLGKEAMLLTAVDTTNLVHSVKRGMKGTQAKAHASGTVVTLGAASVFGPNTDKGVEIAGYVGDLGTPVLPLGSRWIDPDTGYEYILCDSADVYLKGEWVTFTSAGAASQLAATSQGKVGVVAEAVTASDKVFWVQVVGTCTFANTTSDLTTAMPATPSTGTLANSSSSINYPVVRGVICTVDPSTATSPGLGGGVATVVLNNPFIIAGDLLVS